MASDHKIDANRDRRVVIVGIDGANWEIISNLSKKREFNAIRKIINSGYHGTLISTFPYITPAAWTSMYTGVNPHRHGLIDFYLIRRDGGYHYLNYKDSLYPGFWEYLNQEKLKIILINLPMVTESFKINGIVIPGFPVQKPIPYPRELTKIIEKHEYEVHIPGFETRALDRLKVINEATKLAEKRKNLATELIENWEWNVFFVVFVASDLIQHVAINDYDALAKVYEPINEFLENVLSIIDKNDILIVLSDHGFTKIKKVFYTNNWLIDRGYLSYSTGKRISRIVEKIRTTKFWIKYGPKIEEEIWQFFLKVSKRSKRIEGILEKMGRFTDFFALTNVRKGSKAFGFSSNMPIIYLKVMDLDILDDLVNELQDLEDPDTQEKVVNRIYTPDQVDWDGLIGRLGEKFYFPDIIVELKKGYTALTQKISMSKKIIEKPPLQRSGDHAYEGIIMLYGKHVIKSDYERDFIVNVPVSLLWYMGYSAPKELDGVPSKHFFDKTINGENKKSLGVKKIIIRKKMRSSLFKKRG